MNRNWMGAVVGCLALFVASTSVAAPQAPERLQFGAGKPVPPGDVAMGRNMFNAVCWACHSADLGGASGPPLTGPTFYKIWRGRSVDALFDRIHNTMPRDDPGWLSERAARDLVAYIVAYSNKPESLKDGK